MRAPSLLRYFPARSGLIRRSVVVYSATSQTFTSKRLACPFNHADGEHLESVYQRQDGELLVASCIAEKPTIELSSPEFDGYLFAAKVSLPFLPLVRTIEIHGELEHGAKPSTNQNNYYYSLNQADFPGQDNLTIVLTRPSRKRQELSMYVTLDCTTFRARTFDRSTESN